MRVNTRDISLTIIFLAVVVGLCAIAFQYPAPRIRAIDLVKTHTTDVTDVSGNPLTTSDLVQQDVMHVFEAGLQGRAVWSSTDNGGGWYVVTARIDYKDPFGGWEELISAQWRVNVKTKEIEPLDNSARAYMGL